jgi:hypothetical protein
MYFLRVLTFLDSTFLDRTLTNDLALFILSLSPARQRCPSSPHFLDVIRPCHIPPLDVLMSFPPLAPLCPPAAAALREGGGSPLPAITQGRTTPPPPSGGNLASSALGIVWPVQAPSLVSSRHDELLPGPRSHATLSLALAVGLMSYASGHGCHMQALAAWRVHSSTVMAHRPEELLLGRGCHAQSELRL